MLGSFFGFLGVAIGAFGAHGLKKYFEAWPDMQPIFKTAAEYQMFHALALIAAGWAAGRWPNAWMTAAGWLFVAGIVIFCGSLYTLSLTRVKPWGAVAPVGGLALLAAWLCLFIGAWKGRGSG
ncbi:DUF423 domain-containing protein [bacterium]|nr:DUF423 domain-containing protein [bacterium]